MRPSTCGISRSARHCGRGGAAALFVLALGVPTLAAAAPAISPEQAIAAARRLGPVSSTEVGADDFRISDVGGTGDTNYQALNPAVAYDSVDNQYLVVWRADDNVNGMVDEDYEILGQRIDAATGAEVGANDFRISEMAGSGPAGGAFEPAVAYNPDRNEYLVVWHGEGPFPMYAFQEYEIFGQRLDAATGAEVGSNDFRISDMGGTNDSTYGASSPAVVYNPTRSEYLVVWSGDDNVNGLVNDELEIFGQRINAITGAEVGTNDFRISNMGDADSAFQDANRPAVAYNAVDDEYLVVWDGDDATGDMVDNELEIFGQRLDGATGGELGADDFRISTQGPAGDTSYLAVEPAVAFDPVEDQYLVVWTGTQVVGPGGSELEIFGQRLDASGAEIGTHDMRLTDVGPEAIGWDANMAGVAYVPALHQYLVSFRADDDDGVHVIAELDAFVQAVDAATGAEVGPHDYRVSDMGPTGTNLYSAAFPAIACGAPSGECLIVWRGDDDTGGLVDNEWEIFGQRYVSQLALLVDGFEGGDLGAWSVAVP